MKAIRKIGMAMFAVFACMNFVSCSPDNGGESPDSPTNEKKLVRMISYRIEGSSEELVEITEFKYDQNGNFVAAIDKYWTDTIEYAVWESNKSVTWNYYGEIEYKCTIADGKITDIHAEYWDWRSGTNGNWEKVKTTEELYCCYDKEGHISEIGEYEEDTKEPIYKYTWASGKLSMVEDGYDVITFRYNNQTCKGYLPLYFEYTGLYGTFFMIHPELVGMEMTNLPSKIFAGNTTMTYEYELDAEGYVVGCSVNDFYDYGNENGYSSSDYYYEFVWE